MGLFVKLPPKNQVESVNWSLGLRLGASGIITASSIPLKFRHFPNRHPDVCHAGLWSCRYWRFQKRHKSYSRALFKGKGGDQSRRTWRRLRRARHAVDARVSGLVLSLILE